MPLPLPVATKTWIISPNNRIGFVSLADTMARYLFGIKSFLKANGYTVIGSSDGATAALATDKWVTSADAITRGSAAATVQSWIILRDGNGVDMLIAFQGSTDNVCRISFSPGQLFVLAGTATNQPTATDEQVVTANIDMINPTTSVDRVWHGWVSSDAKLCRFAIARAGAWVGRSWGVELFTDGGTIVAPATMVKTVWGFAITAGIGSIVNGSAAGVARPSIVAVPFNCVVHLGCEMFTNNPTNASFFIPELAGQYMILPLSIASATTGARGELGNLIDQWIGSTVAVAGSYYGNLQFIAISGYISSNDNSGVWPWDGITVPLVY
jgi:hypothetical protein